MAGLKSRRIVKYEICQCVRKHCKQLFRRKVAHKPPKRYCSQACYLRDYRTAYKIIHGRPLHVNYQYRDPLEYEKRLCMRCNRDFVVVFNNSAPGPKRKFCTVRCQKRHSYNRYKATRSRRAVG